MSLINDMISKMSLNGLHNLLIVTKIGCLCNICAVTCFSLVYDPKESLVSHVNYHSGV